MRTFCAIAAKGCIKDDHKAPKGTQLEAKGPQRRPTGRLKDDPKAPKGTHLEAKGLQRASEGIPKAPKAPFWRSRATHFEAKGAKAIQSGSFWPERVPKGTPRAVPSLMVGKPLPAHFKADEFCPEAPSQNLILI